MNHLAVFTGSQAQSSAFTQVSLLQTLYENIQNNGLQIANLQTLIAVFSQGAHLQRLQLQSPSIKQAGLLPDFTPVRKAAIGANTFPNVIDLRATPMKFPANESLQAWITQSNAGSEQEYVAILICDQPPAPVTGKPFHTVEFTGTTTLTANALTQCIMTSEQSLPAGKYDIIGARMKTATGIFFRVGIGSWATRPGGVCVTADDSRDPEIQRYGNLGVWFTMQNTDQVVAEVLASSADTAQTLEMDVVGPY